MNKVKVVICGKEYCLQTEEEPTYVYALARKLEKRNNEEILYRQIIIDGVLGIQAGDNPKSLKEMLVSSLPTNQQAVLLGEVSENEGKKKGKKKKEKK